MKFTDEQKEELRALFAEKKVIDAALKDANMNAVKWNAKVAELCGKKPNETVTVDEIMEKLL